MGKPKTEIDAGRASALAAELHALAGKLKRRLREQASAGDLTPSQTAVLVHLDRDGPTTVTALARSEGVRSQSMGATIAVLEAAGLVTGSPDPKDGRQTILSLTPACACGEREAGEKPVGPRAIVEARDDGWGD